MTKMKRTFSTVMLLIASMILLTHSAIPHHNHDKVAVAIVLFGEEETGIITRTTGTVIITMRTTATGIITTALKAAS